MTWRETYVFRQDQDVNSYRLYKNMTKKRRYLLVHLPRLCLKSHCTLWNENGNICHTSDGLKWAYQLNCSQGKHLLPHTSVASACFPVLVHLASGYLDFTAMLLQLKMNCCMVLITCCFIIEEPPGAVSLKLLMGRKLCPWAPGAARVAVWNRTKKKNLDGDNETTYWFKVLFWSQKTTV